jgi:DNA replication and repair protein RecF
LPLSVLRLLEGMAAITGLHHLLLQKAVPAVHAPAVPEAAIINIFLINQQYLYLSMYLEELQLKNFRNYSDINLKFDRTAALFFGDNAQGKTNLLESIRYLSSGKSHRAANQDDLIGWGCEFALIRAHVNGHLIELELRPQNVLKIKVDKTHCRKKSDFTTILPSVIFTPEDLKIIKDGPSNRRDLLDNILESIYPAYNSLKSQYQKILNQRNSLIKSIAGIEFRRGFEDRRIGESNNAGESSRRNTGRGNDEGEMDSSSREEINNPTLSSWDENLAKYGSEIIKKRHSLVNRIGPDFSRLMREFFPAIDAGIFYIYSWNTKSAELMSSESDTPDAFADLSLPYIKMMQAVPPVEEIRQCFLRMLKQNLKKELNYKTTITGPHRDDFLILLNGKDIRSFGSQGQQRISAISLRLCEIEVIRESLKKDPVLLLDDILSELDFTREKIVLNLIKDKYQTFITTSNINYVSHIKEIEKDKIQELVVKDNSVCEVKK